MSGLSCKRVTGRFDYCNKYNPHGALSRLILIFESHPTLLKWDAERSTINPVSIVTLEFQNFWVRVFKKNWPEPDHPR
jgi:hypothetical protein